MAKSKSQANVNRAAPTAEEPLTARVVHDDDRRLDLALRPRALDEFIGQERNKKILGMSITAARGRGEVLDHVLFAGPPGLGKTSLAHIIARELGVNVHVTSGPAIERAADLAAIVNNLEKHDVLFIDEIHRLQRVVEERLYSAMEDFEFHIVVGEGMGARTVAAPAEAEEQVIDLSLRPRTLEEFVGQDRIKRVLRISIDAARGRADVLDHVLFSGPPGLGKTSLAHIIARELGVNLRSTSGPAIERAGDLAAIVNDLERGDVLFIDEIHRLSRAVEEILYPAMEDFELNIVVGRGPGARSMRLAVKPFTMVGATTRSGLLSSPLRDRFGQHFHLDFYGREELAPHLGTSSHVPAPAAVNQHNLNHLRQSNASNTIV